MVVKEKKAKPPKKEKAPPMTVLELDYQLADLPSSQHRAGLAGLVLMIDWLKRQEMNKGICEVTRLGEGGATLRIDRVGLKALLDESYAPVVGERESEKLETRKQSKEIIPPTAIREREVEDPETGETKKIPVYIYPTYTPRGAYLVSYDSTADDAGNGIWVKLWRQLIWRIIRKKYQSQNVFRDRGEGKPTQDAADAWSEIESEDNQPAKLSSSHFIGARGHDAEEVDFRDSGKQKLLLHFWSYVTQIYFPTTVVFDKKTKKPKDRELGYALAIPDVAQLETFCRILPKMLENNRGTKTKPYYPYRPSESIVDVAAESALDMFTKLGKQLALRESGRRTSQVVSGIDVIHVDEAGDDVVIKGMTRLEPEGGQADEYERVRPYLWNHVFRKQRVLNILAEREWYAGFDDLLSKLSYETGFGAEHFSHDARESFRNEVKNLMDDKNINDEVGSPFDSEPEDTNDVSETSPDAAEVSPAALIYKVVGNYINRRLKSKRELEYKDVLKGTTDKEVYGEARKAVVRNAFYAVRSRTGTDFVEYFAATLCSVPQNMPQEHFELLARRLHQTPNEVRTLTMLALSARS